MIATSLPPVSIAAWSHVALAWTFEPSVMAGITLAAALYLLAIRLVRARGRPPWRRAETCCFLAGVAVLAVALASPLDAFADDWLSVHMVQHLLLTLVAAPLLLLGRPLTLAYACSSRRASEALVRLSRTRPLRLLGSPALGFAVFAAVLWTSHLSSLYEAALVDDGIHALEHMLYLATATLFWWPIVARDPGARRLTYPGRVLYIFLSMPMMSLLGFVITYSDRVLYSHYIVAAGSVAAALADQRLGGTIMWESSMLGGATALSFVLVDWMRYDDAQARLADALSTRSAATAEVPGG